MSKMSHIPTRDKQIQSFWYFQGEIQAAICRCFSRYVQLKFFAMFTRKQLFWSLFFYLKKRLHYRYFPVNIAKFLRTAIFIEHLHGCFWRKWKLINVQTRMKLKWILLTYEEQRFSDVFRGYRKKPKHEMG